MRKIGLMAFALFFSANSYAISMEERESLMAEYNEMLAKEREERVEMINSLSPEGELTVEYSDLLQCFDLWEQKTPRGFKAVGETYSVGNEPEKGRLHIKGFVLGPQDIEVPFNFVCALQDDLKIDRLRTYFSMRLDEQLRDHGYKRGAWDNPDLRNLMSDLRKKAEAEVNNEQN